MLHRDKDDFLRTLTHVAMLTSFTLPLVEKDFNMNIDNIEKACRNESKQYLYYFDLDSALRRINKAFDRIS